MVSGSSPLTRGKLHDPADLVGNVRLIPAHAGKTQTWGPGPASRPAHPRSRGENSDTLSGTFESHGSSPLTRGKPVAAWLACGACGLIPAHAGKTFGGDAPPGPALAHPRSRGENCLSSNPKRLCRGSSPLTRGKLGLGMSDSVDKGLIPAHAGKTGAATPILTGGGAHPRSRGENVAEAITAAAEFGSSPLTRGKRPS